jgi:UPF0271 protein
VRVTIEPFGDAALRIVLPSGVQASRLLGALRDLPGVIDAVVGEQSAVVTFDPGCPPEGLARVVERARQGEGPHPGGAEHSIAVTYDGEDLEHVAARAGVSVAEVVRLHTAPSYDVVAVGFLPGFAYLRGLDPKLVGPRRASPRAKVPALSVAVGGPYTGVYPLASPGGWNLLGRAVGFSPLSAASGATLALGDVVRFVRVDA